jgi:hypothetical protein
MGAGQESCAGRSGLRQFFFSRGAVQYENPDVCISRSEAVVGKASGEGWMDGWMDGCRVV